MTQSDSSRTQFAAMKEADWHVIPGTVTMVEKRFTSESLRYAKRTVVSREIRADRQIPDLIEVGADAQGDSNFEMSFGAYDDFLLGALHAVDTDWLTPFSFTSAGSSGDAQFSAPSTITAATAVFTPLRVGQFIKITGATNAANNGIFQIATVASATSITVVETSLVNANSQTVNIRASMIRNAATEHSFLLEKWFADIDKFIYFPGMEVGRLQLQVATEAILTGTLGWLGEKAVASATTIDTAGGYGAATTADVMNATSNVGTIRKGGSTLSTPLQGISLNLNNNLRGKPAIGNKTAIGIGRGVADLQGTVTAYFEDLTLYNEMINHSSTSLHFRVTDAAGNAYLFTIPKLRWADGDPLIEGQNQDVLLPINFQAVRDPTTNCTIQIDKLAA